MKKVKKETCISILKDAFGYYPSFVNRSEAIDVASLSTADFNDLAKYIDETIGVTAGGKSLKSLLNGAGPKNSTINILCAFLLVKKNLMTLPELKFGTNVSDNRYYVRRYFEITSEGNQKLPEGEVNIEQQSANKPFYKKNYFYITGLLLFAIATVSIYNATRAEAILPEIEVSVEDKSDYFPKEIKVRYDLKSARFLKNSQVGFMATPVLLNKLKGEVYLNAPFPGLYWVSLYSDKNIFDVKRLLLPSNGWRAYLNRTERLQNDICMIGGLMHLQDKSIIENPEEDYYTSFNIFENFGIDGDNFTLEADIKNPPNENSRWAYDISVDVIGYENPIKFNFLSPDAMQHANMIVGDTDFKIDKKKAILKKMGILFPEWRHLTVTCKNNKISISLDDQVIINENYKGVIGQVLGLQFYFKGSGYAKNVTLNGKSI